MGVTLKLEFFSKNVEDHHFYEVDNRSISNEVKKRPFREGKKLQFPTQLG